MTIIKNQILFLIILIVAFSCAKPTPLELLSGQEPSLRSQDRYNSYLALEYLRFARKLMNSDDKKSAQYFAQKGRNSALGLEVIPENPLVWKADQAQMTEMVLMQKRLENVLMTSQIKTYLPIQAAHLFYLYDCWISRESQQIFRADEMAPCRVRFTALLEEIENYIEESKKDRTEKIQIVEPEFERFNIDFDLNSFVLNDNGNKQLLAFLKHLKKLDGDYKLLVVGSADRAGKEIYNEALAMKRAAIVENYLRKNGVMQDYIETRSVGEDFPDLLTKDNVQNQLNRNVAIYVLKGHGEFKAYPLPLLENIIYKNEIDQTMKDRGLEGIN